MARMIAATIATTLAACTLLAATAVQAQTTGHITGIGGVFVKTANPTALSAWYRDVLGIHLETWGGAILRYDAPGHPPMALWTAFPPTASEFAPSTRDFMLNLAVDNLAAFLDRLHRKGVPILNQTTDSTGSFAWLLDPDGTKIELWQPK